jgi:hypothetical protein
MGKLQDAISAHEDSAEAQWGAALLVDDLKKMDAIRDTKIKARCFAGVLVSGPEDIYFVAHVGNAVAAFTLARRLTRMWHDLRSYRASLSETDRQSYDDFPIEITEALYIRCEPTLGCTSTPSAGTVVAAMKKLLAP